MPLQVHGKILRFREGNLDVDIPTLRQQLGPNVTIRTLNTRINNFLADKSPDPSYRIFVRLLTLNPISYVTAVMHRGNLVNGTQEPANWWVEG